MRILLHLQLPCVLAMLATPDGAWARYARPEIEKVPWSV